LEAVRRNAKDEEMAELFLQWLSKLPSTQWVFLLDDMGPDVGASPLLQQLWSLKGGRIVCSSRHDAKQCRLQMPEAQCTVPSKLTSEAVLKVFENRVAFLNPGLLAEFKEVQHIQFLLCFRCWLVLDLVVTNARCVAALRSILRVVAIVSQGRI
jgi:hypothetical protein